MQNMIVKEPRDVLLWNYLFIIFSHFIFFCV